MIEEFGVSNRLKMINLRKFEFNALMRVLIHCVPWDPPSNESLLENYL